MPQRVKRGITSAALAHTILRVHRVAMGHTVLAEQRHRAQRARANIRTVMVRVRRVAIAI